MSDDFYHKSNSSFGQDPVAITVVSTRDAMLLLLLLIDHVSAEQGAFGGVRDSRRSKRQSVE